MASASLTIAISGSYNGNAITKAQQSLQKMQTVAASTAPGVAGSLARIGGSAAELGGKIYNAGTRMESFGKSATAMVTVPIVAAAAACGKAAIDIDTSLTNVRKTVDGTEEQYQGLKQAAIEFSKTNAVSASQILDIQALGAQLGFTREELQNFGEVVSGLDIATNMDAEQAGTELAQFANITKMAHSEASNYASALVGLGNTSATTESDISSMSMRIAAAGTQVGMSQADILGLAAALSSMGIEAEAGGTAISTIMSQIDKDIATNSESVETWASAAGMSAEQFADAWRGNPVDALSALFAGMESATAEGGNMSVMLEELGIDSVRQTDIMKRLAGNSDLVATSVATANREWEANTALQNEVDNRNESMAARFEMLKNKVIAVAESVGTPLVNAALEFVDAAEPVLDVVTDAANAFSEMDEQDQKNIVGLIAAAAAFGPVVTVAGKLTQGYGNLIVKLGAGAQALARAASGASEMSAEQIKAAASTEAADAATTKATASAIKQAEADLQAEISARNRAMSQEYLAKNNELVAKSSATASDTEIAALEATTAEAKKNTDEKKQAVKVAQQKVDALKADAAAEKESEAATKANTTATKASEAAAKADTTATKASEAATKTSTSTTKASETATKAHTTAVKLQTTAMNLGKTAATGLSTALKAVAPIAVITALVSVASVLEQVKEKSDTLKTATEGLSGGLGAYAAAFGTASRSTEEHTVALDNMAKSASDVIQSQADLATSLNETFSELGTSSGMVEQYRDTVERLGEKTNLTAEEQAELAVAVQGINDACGTTFSVIDGQNGKLSENKDAIMAVADAWQQQALAQAASQATVDLMTQHLQNQAALKSATQELTQAQENLGSAVADGSQEWYDRKAAEEAAQRKVDELTAADAACTDQIETMNGIVAENREAFQSTQDALSSFIGKSDALKGALEAAGISTGDFAHKLSEVGVSTTDLAALTDDKLVGMVSSYDGSLGSIVQACQEYGVEIPASLSDSITGNAGQAGNASKLLRDITVDPLTGLPWDFAQTGSELPGSMASGISANANQASGATRTLMDAVVLELTGGDVKAAAAALGHDIDQGLVDGITGAADMPPAAIGVMSEETINAAKSAFDSHSPSQVMYQLGTDIDAGLTNGVNDSASQPTSAMSTMATLMQNAISGLPGFSQNTGSSSGSNLASSIGSFAGSVSSSALSLFNSATGGISGTPGAFRGTGSDAAGSFSGAIGGASAYGSGRSLADTANSGLESISAYGAGANFVQGFGNGMSGVSIWGIAYNVGMSALGAIKSALGIASPSKEARKVGQFFVQGAELGMKDEQSSIEAQSEAVSRAMSLTPTVGAYAAKPALQGSESGFAGGGNTYNYYTVGDITLDLSSVKDFVTLEQLFEFLKRAKASNLTKARA